MIELFSNAYVILQTLDELTKEWKDTEHRVEGKIVWLNPGQSSISICFIPYNGKAEHEMQLDHDAYGKFMFRDENDIDLYYIRLYDFGSAFILKTPTGEE
jgi:hypothetical protein